MTDALAADPAAQSVVLDNGGPPVSGAEPPHEDVDAADRLVALLRHLPDDDRGIETIYEALEVVATSQHLDDLMVVVEDPFLGSQVFRLGRRPIGREDLDALGPRTVLASPTALEADVESLLDAVARAALTLHLARRHQLRDAATGLLARGVFNEALRAAAAQSSRYGWTFTVVLVRAGADEEPPPAEVRRLGRAFGRALRSGDTGTRLQRASFGALLPNATAESMHAFLRRFLDESGLDSGAIRYASSTMPNESVDPAELFRLAAARLHQD